MARPYVKSAPDALVASLRQHPAMSGLAEETLQIIAEIIRSDPATQVTALLRRVPLFESLRDEDLQGIQQIATHQQYAAGTRLFAEGESGDTFYVVLHGAVELTKRTPSGQEERLAVRRDGEAFGEMALLTDKPRSASARAVEPTQVLTVSREAFFQLLGGDSPALRLLQGMAKALWALDVRFAAVAKPR
ncbi:MAG: cyclic nucleotide-binding domain-containing protein [Gemmatimonadetes bacterium]|nr:cyclic nucleotide-binding domain-containing protein [Gemmatimonadota bacterium]